jgi:hypothetical protein
MCTLCKYLVTDTIVIVSNLFPYLKHWGALSDAKWPHLRFRCWVWPVAVDNMYYLGRVLCVPAVTLLLDRSKVIILSEASTHGKLATPAAVCSQQGWKSAQSVTDGVQACYRTAATLGQNFAQYLSTSTFSDGQLIT